MVEKIAKMETDVSYIKKSIDSININISTTNTKFDRFVDAVDKKYANKKIETKVINNEKAINGINITLAKWAGGIITASALITGVISAIL